MIDPTSRRRLGNTGLAVSGIGIGSGGLGSVPSLFGYDTPEDRAVATVKAAFASPLNFYDTSAGYSAGESERRIGLAIAECGGVPKGWVLATKVDPDQKTRAYDGAAVRRSFEGSLCRLGVDRIELLHLHDPEQISFADAMAPDGPVAELIRLKDEGLVGHLGVGGGPVGNLMQFLQTGVFEVVLTHNRYTLLDRTSEPLITWATANGVGVLQGAPYGGGVLAKGVDATSTYCYAPMNQATLGHARALTRICAEAGVPLGAAALQFPLRDERIASVIVGVTHPQRIQESLDWATWPIPDDVWDALIQASGHDAGLDNSTR
ncbi:MAG: aldo/keto reductase [Propionibacteriaceae bacterium]|jgi:D-threo-aldose 1-dehydrogenase|nr:aldo/keto reductase [Propionibacteriaceae bacterium]